MGANAEYAVEIAAHMSGDETLAELDTLTADLMGAGKQAEFFQSAIQNVSRDLKAAAAATAAANGALGAAQSEYRGLESEAAQAAKTVEKLGLRGDTMSRKYLEASQILSVVNPKLEAQAGILKTLEGAADAAAAKEKKLGDTLAGVTKLSGHVDKAIVDQSKEWRVLGGVLGQLPGPLGSLGRGFAVGEAAEEKFAGRFGADAGLAVKLGLGIAGVTAVALVLTAALVVGAVKVAAYGISLADAARSAGLTQEAVEATTPAIAAMHGELAGLSKTTGQTVPALDALAKQLLDAGVSSDRLEGSLQAAALAETALGKGGSAQYVALEKAASDAQQAVAEAAHKSGGAVSKELTDKLTGARAAADAFANTAQTKLGGIVARQLQGLSAQSDRLQSNLAGTFGGLDIDPVLAGVGKLVGLFDKSSESGRALKFLFEALFQPLIDQADTAATAVEAFILGVEIGAVKLYIVLKPTIKAIEDFLGLDDPSLALNFKTITKIGEALAPVLIAIAAVVGGVLLAALVTMGVVIGAQVAIWYGIVKAVEITLGVLGAMKDFVTGAFTGAWHAVTAFLESISLSDIGRNLIMGFVSGITGSIGAVVSAVRNAMGEAISAAKSVLGIASPSKVFAGLADHTTDGYTNTLDDNAGEVQGSMNDMLAVGPSNDVLPDPAEQLKQAQLSGDSASIERLQGATSPADNNGGTPRDTGAAPKGGTGAALGSGNVFNFYGLPDAKGALAAFGEMLDAAIEGDTAKLGAARAKVA